MYKNKQLKINLVMYKNYSFIPAIKKRQLKYY